MSRRRSLSLVVAVVALLAIVALVALGRPLGKDAGNGSGLPQTFWDYVLTTVFVVLVLVVAASVTAFFYFRHGGGDVKLGKTRSPARSVASVIALGVLIWLLGPHLEFLRHLFHPHGSKLKIKTPTASGGGELGGGKTLKQSTHLVLPEIVVVLAALLVLAAVFVSRSRMRPTRRRPGAGPPDELMTALDESLDDLRADPDVRRAIIAAYARMEKALAAAGIPRNPAEAPLEYLERVLRPLDTSEGAVRRLTDLFEWARFSQHEPEAPMRDEAIDALVAVRDELRAAEPVEAW